MELCYDGAMTMPSGFVMLDDDEMCYLEGGEIYTKSLKNATSYFATITAISNVGANTLGICITSLSVSAKSLVK